MTFEMPGTTARAGYKMSTEFMIRNILIKYEGIVIRSGATEEMPRKMKNWKGL